MDLIDWAYGTSPLALPVTMAEPPPKTDPTAPLDAVYIAPRKSNLTWGGELYVSHASPAIANLGWEPQYSDEIALGILARTAESLNGKDLTTVGSAITPIDAIPSSQTVLDSTYLTVNNQPPLTSKPQLVVAANSAHFAYAYIDSDFNGTYDRRIDLGYVN